MATIHFIQPDGTRRTCVNFEGMTLMQLAVGNLVDGIDASCGGMMQCATCHCYIDPDWIEATGAALPDERDMLEMIDVAEIKPTSRLSCQVQLSEALDGLGVHIPSKQKG